MVAFSVLWLGLVVLIARVSAQEANCTLPSFSWTFNSVGQSPCHVYNGLIVPCGAQAGHNLTQFPNSSYFYAGASTLGDYPCSCNTVAYSLLSACAACQGSVSYLNWSTFTFNCTRTWIGVFPELIPAGVRIPHWAFLNVLLGFDPNAALSDAIAHSGSASETTGLSITSTSSGSATSVSSAPSTIFASTTTSPSTPTPTIPPSTSPHAAPVGVIAGATVGGVVGIVLIAILIFLLRRRNSSQPQVAGPAKGDGQYLMASHPYSATLATVAQPGVFRPYNPDDPTTFPPIIPSPDSTQSASTKVSHYNGFPQISNHVSHT